MLNNLIYLVLLLFGAGSIVFAQQLGFETTPAFLATRGGVGLLGLVLLGYSNVGILLGLFKFNFNWKKPELLVKPSNNSLADYNAVAYLRDRCVVEGSDEGVKLCTQLSTILFEIDTPKKA